MRRIVLTAAAWLVLAPAAHAEQPIVVRADGGARAEIIREPFRMAFFDGAGRKVLEEAAPASGPKPVANAQPAPLAVDRLGGDTLYAPLAFLVGARHDAQYGSGSFLWQGNALAGLDGGTMFSATQVLDSVAKGNGVRLTVATDDPSGRRLDVTVTPGRGATIRVRAVPTDPTGVAAMTDSFASGADEAFRGFGGRHNAIDQRGNSFYNWIEQENLSPGGFQPVGDAVSNSQEGYGDGRGGYMFPNGKTAAYNVQNLFVSSRPYGFQLNRPELSAWRLDSDRPDAWQASVAAPVVDYTVAPGDAMTATASLNAITGRHRVPPTWALGAQTSRLLGVGDDGVKYEQLVRDDLAWLEAHRHFRLKVYDMFAWQGILRQPGGEAKVRELVGRFHALGIRVLAYFLPWASKQGSVYTNPADWNDVLARGIYVKNAAGAPYVMAPTAGFDGAGVMLDWTNPDIRPFWKQRTDEVLDLGFDGFMEDFGEQITNDMVFADGRTGAQMHNLYPVVYHRLSQQIIDDYEREHPGREIWRYTRSGFSGADGQPGSESYVNANFPGDNDANWTHNNGLASSATDMLNRAIGGAWGYTTDIGGYSGITTKELLTRWIEWAALSPYMRLHNSNLSETQQPWTFGADTVAVWNAMADLRAAATPLLARLWREAVQTGVPFIRPMWMAFPGDAEAARQDQQWMLGDDVLVAPVVSEGATSRRVYFPAGCWQRPGAGERHESAGYAVVPAPLDVLPYYFRCGTQPFEPPVRGGADTPPSPPGAETGAWIARQDDPTGQFSGPAGKGYVGLRDNQDGSYEAGVCNRGSGAAYYQVKVPDPSRSGTRSDCP